MHQRQLCTHLGVMSDAVLQLQSSLEQNDALQSERASLTNSLRKLEAFKRNLLHTLQASDVVVRQRLAICGLVVWSTNTRCILAPCAKVFGQQTTHATQCISYSTYSSVCLKGQRPIGSLQQHDKGAFRGSKQDSFVP